MNRDLRRWWPLLLVAALLFAVGAATLMSDDSITLRPPDLGQNRQQPLDEPSADPSQSAEPTEELSAAPVPQQAVKPVPRYVTLVVLGLVASTILVVVALLLWALLRSVLGQRSSRRYIADEETGTEVAARADVLAAVEAGLADLVDAERDPRAAVIACWLRLEEAAAAAGTPRLPSDSPADLVDRLLGSHRVARGTLTDLAEMYRVARYATTHIIDESMRQQAVAALERVRVELRDSVPLPDPDEPSLRFATPAGGR